MGCTTVPGRPRIDLVVPSSFTGQSFPSDPPCLDVRSRFVSWFHFFFLVCTVFVVGEAWHDKLGIPKVLPCTSGDRSRDVPFDSSPFSGQPCWPPLRYVAKMQSLVWLEQRVPACTQVYAVWARLHVPGFGGLVSPLPLFYVHLSTHASAGLPTWSDAAFNDSNYWRPTYPALSDDEADETKPAAP